MDGRGGHPRTVCTRIEIGPYGIAPKVIDEGDRVGKSKFVGYIADRF
jgi:hypothetical protein